ACDLGWPVGTVRSRLARGRERLRGHLIRRGLAPSVASAAMVVEGSANAAVSEVVTNAICRSATKIATGQAVFGMVPDSVVALTRKGFREMFRQTIRSAAVAALVPLGAAILYASWPAARAVGSAPPPASGLAEENSRKSLERLAPLLGTWEAIQGPRGRVVVIKVLSADPALAKGLGFDAPFVCTWTDKDPGKTDPKPNQLLFVDPSQDPSHITFQALGSTVGDDDHPDGIPEIYRVEEDTLILLGPKRLEQTRPTDFDRGENLRLFRRRAEKATGDNEPSSKPERPTGER
ncbi:hypothetical protein ACYOEI_27430, partial [Singulisphaera rosea]